jgi:hypothetical protein
MRVTVPGLFVGLLVVGALFTGSASATTCRLVGNQPCSYCATQKEADACIASYGGHVKYLKQ